MIQQRHSIIVLLICIVRINAQSPCVPVVDCITGYGATLSLAFFPDPSSYNELTLSIFIDAMCNNQGFYAKCLENNATVFTQGCAYLGDFMGLPATQDQKTSLVSMQCSHIPGLVGLLTSLNGLDGGSQLIVGMCLANFSALAASPNPDVCALAHYWEECGQSLAGNFTAVTQVYWSALVQMYEDVFCPSYSKANVTISSSMTLSLVLVFLLCFIHVPHIRIFFW